MTIPDAQGSAVDAPPPAGPATHRDYTPAVYGSLLVTTLVAVQWRGDAHPELIALSLLVSIGVFWLTHVWSSLVNRRVQGPVRRAVAVELASHEAPMLSAALVPAGILALARPFGLDVDGAIAVALVVSIAQLFVWGLAVGRAAHDRWSLALGVAIVDVLLGLVIVAMKILVLH